MVISGRVEMNSGSVPGDESYRQLELRYDLAAYTAESYAKAGFDVVLQDIYIGDVLPSVVARFTYRPLYLVVLCPSAAEVAKREAARPKSGYGGAGGFTPEGFCDMLYLDTPRLGLWLDTTSMTPEETVDAILARTEAGEGRIENYV